MSGTDEKAIFDPGIKNRLLPFLEEDIRTGDITSEYVLDDRHASARIVSKEEGILAGMEETEILFELLDCRVLDPVADGGKVVTGQVIASLEGKVKNLLLGERVALNILSRMSGIATKTNEFVEKVRVINEFTRIAATRKTTPGFRFFEKKAVCVGGGDPHRYALDDMVLIKENHIRIAGGVRAALEKARRKSPFPKKIEIEVEDLSQFREAMRFGADIIMLDNMSPGETKECREYLELEHVGGMKPLIEISGNMNLENVESYAPYADIISVGSLTHSYDSLDFSMLVD